jgi:hypothetical protein
VLGYGSVPTGVTVTTGANSVTFTGLASVADYQQLLQSITLASTTAGIRSVAFVVTDDQGNQSDAAATAVTVVGLPTEVTPLVVALPAAAGTVGTPSVVSSVVVIADLDSDEIDSATVTIENPEAGDVLGYGSVPTGVTVSTGANSVTFTGLASVADYQQLLQSITLTSTTAGIRSVTFTVVDDQGNQSDAAATAVTVVGVPTEVTPLVVALPVATGTAGTPTVVSSVIVIADLDSDQIDSATVTITNPSAGDVLGYGNVPTGITVTTGANSVTFTGPATVAEYEQLLASVTLTSPTTGITRVSFTVTDDQGNVSAAAGTAVTVIGVPTAATPLVVTSLVNVAYTAGSSSVAVDPGVIVLDVDSTTMNGATVAIADPDIGDTLTWGSLPTGITADYDNGVLTFSGAASIDDYQQLLRTVRFSTDPSALATIKSIEFQVTDDSNRVSTPASVTVTVVSLPITATPAIVTSVVNVSYTAGNSATVIDPNLTILDADSSNMSGAVVSIVGGVTAGEALSFTPQAGISGAYNPATGVLTFSGTASKETYQQLLRTVTFEADPSALATIKSISFVITDAQSNTSGPGLVAVTVLNAPVSVAPLVITSGVNLAYTAGNSPVTVDSGISLLDLDSSTIQGATVRISGGFASGDELTFTAPSGITGNYNAATGVLTFTGDASLADYQTALRSVQLSTDASALAAIKTVSFAVTDLEGSLSLPGSVAVTVLAAPVNLAPLVTTLLGPIYTAGNTEVQVNPLLTVLDLDTANMGGATVAITGNFAAGDVLSFTPTSGIVGNYDTATGVLTFVGDASTATYQQLLRSVTFASGASGTTAVKTITFTVTDSLGATSPNATALVTQTANSAPLLTAPLGGGVLLLGAQVVSPTAVILDDSSFLNQAVVTITNVQSVDVLSFTATGSITGSYSGGVLTLSGLGTVAEYQSVLQSVRFSKTGLNLLGFRNITMVVRDAQGLDSNTTSGTLTLIL